MDRLSPSFDAWPLSSRIHDVVDFQLKAKQTNNAYHNMKIEGKSEKRGLGSVFQPRHH